MNTSLNMAEITLAHSSDPLQRIGFGACGSVWADASLPDIDKCGHAIVLKRADGSPSRSISNEATIHKHVLSCLESSKCNTIKTGLVNFPSHVGFLDAGATIWSDILRRLPVDSTPCEALISERIMPLPRATRKLLVEQLWNGPVRVGEIESILNDKRNEHCLVRPYLGRRRTRTSTRRLNFIKLRNYLLHIDQIEELGLPAHEYASAMADALAFLLWFAEIDACDVEFVLARPRSGAAEGSGNHFTTGPLGSCALWVLDFDCCKPLPMTTKGVQQAVEKFWRNDPYYPNPDTKCEEDASLWNTFKTCFLDTSAEIMASKPVGIRHLPEEFINRVVDSIRVYSKGVPTATLL
ncbi:zinc finger protein-domain-containing protein [Podospora aff. communis PSN243]|uniref:Zinc finger protein-domain-containing protein n=1 Tax=Podospora aff. communis PSN243 TaxID=3040156 RepID=A0AAV9G5J9_9PEZI|nr:zinc finger protein-domain-containing protein [Podospora aff. communis PSN243]